MSDFAFIFPGQGSQFIGMGQDLAEAFPAAKAVFEEVDDALVVCAGAKSLVVAQYRWNDSGGAVGRGSDDSTTGRVFLVYRQRIKAHPIQHIERVG